MTEEEQRFFADMRNTVARAVRENGLDQVIGFSVTEQGVTVHTTNGDYIQQGGYYVSPT